MIRGCVSLGSGLDVIQVADGQETGVTLLLLVLGLGGSCWLLRPRWRDRLAFGALLYGWFLWLPALVALGLGAEYGLQGVLSARGYDYCTFHVTDAGKGSDGTYVYVRRGVADGCAAVRAVFPPGTLVAGRRKPFDLPAR